MKRGLGNVLGGYLPQRFRRWWIYLPVDLFDEALAAVANELAGKIQMDCEQDRHGVDIGGRRSTIGESANELASDDSEFPVERDLEPGPVLPPSCRQNLPGPLQIPDGEPLPHQPTDLDAGLGEFKGHRRPDSAAVSCDLCNGLLTEIAPLGERDRAVEKRGLVDQLIGPDFAPPGRRSTEDTQGVELLGRQLGEPEISVAPDNKASSAPSRDREALVSAQVIGHRHRSGPENEPHGTDFADPNCHVIGDDMGFEPFDAVRRDCFGDQQINGVGASAQEKTGMKPPRSVEEGGQL